MRRYLIRTLTQRIPVLLVVSLLVFLVLHLLPGDPGLLARDDADDLLRSPDRLVARSRLHTAHGESWRQPAPRRHAGSDVGHHPRGAGDAFPALEPPRRPGARVHHNRARERACP